MMVPASPPRGLPGDAEQTPLIKAIARAFRWRDMLESGEYATIREIATTEKIISSYDWPRPAADAVGAGYR